MRTAAEARGGGGRSRARREEEEERERRSLKGEKALQGEGGEEKAEAEEKFVLAGEGETEEKRWATWHYVLRWIPLNPRVLPKSNEADRSKSSILQHQFFALPNPFLLLLLSFPSPGLLSAVGHAADQTSLPLFSYRRASFPTE
ncbi:hypothetical protein Droror1_Dr00007189 [Drosera rotundifolia]